MPFIGVVSNRTTDFDTNPFSSQTLLIDAYGIGADHYCVYNASQYLMEDDMNYPGMEPGNWVTVKYVIDETKLVFENLKGQKTYQMILPNNIDGINKWYPAIGLRFENDECEIKDVFVQWGLTKAWMSTFYIKPKLIWMCLDLWEIKLKQEHFLFIKNRKFNDIW